MSNIAASAPTNNRQAPWVLGRVVVIASLLILAVSAVVVIIIATAQPKPVFTCPAGYTLNDEEKVCFREL